jgi:nucleoside-diphosphate-sugar epimerase
LSVNPHVVVHLAGVSVAPTYRDLYDANVVFAANLLDASLAMAHKPRVLVAGSAAEYGPVPLAQQPVREDSRVPPQHSLWRQQAGPDDHTPCCGSSRGLPVVIARLFNPIGPGMPKSLALGSFAHQIAQMGTRGGVLSTGDLDAVRDFMDMYELLQASGRLVVEGLQGHGGREHLHGGGAASFRSDAALDRHFAGVHVELQHDVSRRGNSDVKAFVGDPSRLKALGLRARA